MMPRGMTPTRVRRRQSDAKWRASVAMCYNIMKNVIPNQKKLSRRKVSKALTLKETERHIVNLERKLKEVIEDRAPMSGKVVMVEREDNSMYPATFEDIKRDFAHKQHSYFASSNGSGKKRYNIPADIEASLENISQQSCRLVIVNRSQVRSTTTMLPKLFKPATRKMYGAYQYDSHSHLENLLNPTSQLDDQDYPEILHLLPNTPSKATKTSASPVLHVVTPLQPTVKRETTPGTPSGKGSHSYLTPTRQNSQTVVCPGSSRFTPVKLPEGPERSDLLLPSQDTPDKSIFGSPFSNFSLPKTSSIGFNDVSFFDIEDEETNSNLLCTETIDLDDLSPDCVLDTQFGQQVSSLSNDVPEELRPDVQPDTPKTMEPKCRRKLDQLYQEDVKDFLVPTGEELYSDIDGPDVQPDTPKTVEPKCRRKLDQLYQEEVKDFLVPTGEELCSDIDGYLLFYDDNSVSLYPQEEEGKVVDDGVSCMWSSLTPHDEKPVKPGIAGSQYGLDGSSCLSTDLFDWDLKSTNYHTIQVEYSLLLSTTYGIYMARDFTEKSCRFALYQQEEGDELLTFKQIHVQLYINKVTDLTDFSGSSEACQEVPGYEMTGSLMDNRGYSSDLVPDIEQFSFNGFQGSDQDSDQVVPDINSS